MRIHATWFLLLFLPCFLACSSLPAPTKPKLNQHEFAKIPPFLEKLIQQKMQDKEITGLSIALIGKGELIWSQGFGFATRHDAVLSDTLFRAGSLAKMLNAVIVMRLAEQGKLDLHAPIQTYLPEFSVKSRFLNSPPITLKNLLSHQSGLPSDLIQGMWVENPANFSLVLDYLADVYVTQPADRLVNYSNIGFDVIGAVIERVSAKRYQQVMNEFLLELKMDNSAFSAFPQDPPTAHGFNQGRPQTEFALRDVPAAGLSSNVEDLAKLMQLFFNAKPQNTISPANLELILSDFSSDKLLNFDKRVGLGMFFYDDIFHPSLRLFVHDGATPNHRALMIFAPDHQYGVVLMANSPNATATLFQLANDALALLHEASYGKYPPQKHIAWPSKQPEDITDFDAISGYYATSFGLARIFRDGDKLKCHFAGRTFELTDKHKVGLYFLQYKLFGLFNIPLGNLAHLAFSARQVESRRVLVAQTTVGTTVLLGEKVEPAPLSKAWQNASENIAPQPHCK